VIDELSCISRKRRFDCYTKFSSVVSAGLQLTFEVITTPTALGWMRTMTSNYHWREPTHIRRRILETGQPLNPACPVCGPERLQAILDKHMIQ